MDPVYLEIFKWLGGLAVAGVGWLARDLSSVKKSVASISERVGVAEVKLKSVEERQAEDRREHTAELAGFRRDIKEIQNELRLIRKDFGAELRSFSDKLIEAVKR